MPVYRYHAVNLKGKTEKGILDASTPAAARKALRAKGLLVRELKQDEERRDREMLPFLAKILYRVPRKEVALFARQLGTLLDAGIPLDRSLQNIVEQTENPYLKKALIQVRSDIVEGDSLSKALGRHRAIFPDIYSNLVEVGEQTGTYEKSLLRLADLEEANLRMQNRVITAMVYPLVMMSFLGLVLIFLLSVVIPQIQELFAQMNAELPFVTRLVIGLSNFITSWYVFLLIAVLIVAGYFVRRWISTPQGRRRFEETILGIPIVGPLAQKVILARFTRNLGVMLESRVSLIVALQVTSRIVNHAIFGAEIAQAIERIREGSGITDAFRDSVVLTHLVRGMLSAGEATDRVAPMVTKIADILEQEVDASVQRFSSLLEPAMIVFMGLMIIVIMIAVLQPMYDLTRQLQY